jgi:hypothetical protein
MGDRPDNCREQLDTETGIVSRAALRENQLSRGRLMGVHNPAIRLSRNR